MANPFHILLAVGNGSEKGAAILPAYLGLVSNGERRNPDEQSNVLDLYDELRPALRRYLSCIGLRREGAEDVIQETFLRLYRHFLAGRAEKNLRAWIFRVAHNLAVDTQKSDRRMAVDTDSIRELLYAKLDPSLSPEELYIRKEQLARLQNSVARLSEQQRQCLHLRAEGLRYREIGAVLGVSTQRIADVVQEALARLAGDLNE